MGNETKLFDHEVRLVKIETILEENTKDTKEILLIIKNGLSTQVALNKDNIKRLWWFIPVGIGVATTVFSFFI